MNIVWFTYDDTRSGAIAAAKAMPQAKKVARRLDRKLKARRIQADMRERSLSGDVMIYVDTKTRRLRVDHQGDITPAVADTAFLRALEARQHALMLNHAGFMRRLLMTSSTRDAVHICRTMRTSPFAEAPAGIWRRT